MSGEKTLKKVEKSARLTIEILDFSKRLKINGKTLGLAYLGGVTG